MSPAWLTASITHQVLDLFPILERSEAYSYLCCPTELLRIILSTSQVSVSILGTPSAVQVSEATESALVLLNRAQALDTRAWAARFLPGGASSGREHVASAHRAAACLYILQAIPSARERAAPLSSEALVVDILDHLSRVGEGAEHFKATSWPTFVAGAETRDPATRAWLLGRLLAIWRVCPWGYIFTAVEMLRRMWELGDAKAEEAGGEGGRISGLRELWAMHLDFLLI